MEATDISHTRNDNDNDTTMKQNSVTNEDALVGPGAVQLFVQDQSKLEADKIMSYLFMLARGIHVEVPMVVDLQCMKPFEKALELGVLKKKSISITKPMVIQELRRRNAKKLNVNNKKVDELFDIFHEVPLEDTRDIAFIKDSISQYMSEIKNAVEEAEERKKKTGGRAEVTDRLRWMMTIDLCDDVREAYQKIQEVLNREQLDARNTDAAPKDFHDLVAETFNDETWAPETFSNPDLHSFFSSPIRCEKREYFSLTKEKSKSLLMDYKHKLNEICKRYELSGNGNGQLDSDGEEDTNIEERQFGRVNLDLAKLKGGDDRQNFLKHESIDLLYFWDIMDRHDLIHFTTAQLRGPNSASTSQSRPSVTSYQSPSNDSYDVSRGNQSAKKAKYKNDNDIISIQMSHNVNKVGASIDKMNEQHIIAEINSLRKEKLQLKNQWRLERKTSDYDSEEDGTFYADAVKDIEESIRTSQKYLDDLKEAR